MSTANPDNDQQKLELEIYNLSFRLRAPAEEHERLQRAARHVDALMRQLSENQTTPDTSKLAMQAALLTTAEYYRMMDDHSIAHGITDDVKQRVDTLIEQLDQHLTHL